MLQLKKLFIQELISILFLVTEKYLYLTYTYSKLIDYFAEQILFLFQKL